MESYWPSPTLTNSLDRMLVYMRMAAACRLPVHNEAEDFLILRALEMVAQRMDTLGISFVEEVRI